jgi:peptidoglycan/LPS O-acetylase OafA/YrhL
MGSLLALLSQRDYSREALRRFLIRIVLPTGLIATIVLNVLLYSKVDWKAYVILLDTAVALIFCWLIGSASLGFKGRVGAVLELRPLVYCGRITYGIYVYHLFMPLLISPIFRRLGWTFPQRGTITLLLSTIATLLVASLSWFLMERPINNVKRYFDYRTSADDSLFGQTDRKSILTPAIISGQS